MIHLTKREDGYVWRPKEASAIHFAFFNMERMNWVIHFKPNCAPVVSIKDSAILNEYYFKFKKLKEYDYKGLTQKFVDYILAGNNWTEAVRTLLSIGLSKEDLATLFGFEIEQLDLAFPDCGEDD